MLATYEARQIASQILKGKGHSLMEEAPREVIPRLVAFIHKSP